jgi:hypothetical protein
MEHLVESGLAGGTAVLENLPPVLLCPPQTPLDLILESNLDRRRGKPATNRLRFDMALKIK